MVYYQSKRLWLVVPLSLRFFDRVLTSSPSGLKDNLKLKNVACFFFFLKS